MQTNERLALEINACLVRKLIIEGTYNAKCGHPGGSLSCADVMTYLYFREMNIDPENPEMPERDRLVLSKGHCAPALYGALALRGYFPESEIARLRQIGSMLQGHPSYGCTPGVDMTTGSLGQGFSAAVGIALSAKAKGQSYRTYAVLGDGEIQEGQVWEAAMFASAKKLTNLTAIIDNNNLQIDGPIDEVNSPYPIDEKFAAFGWHTININGHDFSELEKAFDSARAAADRPTAIIMKTVKGRGVSFMEDQAAWHGKAPKKDEYDIAMAELDEHLRSLKERQ